VPDAGPSDRKPGGIVSIEKRLAWFAFWVILALLVIDLVVPHV
jgi:hypothetical protein